MKLLKTMFATLFVLILFSLTAFAAETKTLNVCDYGASGSSAADQTEFFSETFKNALPGDTVFVPDGTYSISSLLIPTGVNFRGESRDGTILIANTADSTIVSLRLGSDITFSDMTVDGAMIAKYCVYIKSGSNNTVDNVKMGNLPHKGSVIGVYINGRCTNTVIKNCLIENIGVRPSGDENEDKGTGICIYGNSMFSYPHDDSVRIENNVINMTGRTGIAGDYVTDVIITGNTIKNTGYVIGKGLSIEIYGAECRNCIIENNTVDHWMSIHGEYHAVRHNKVGTDFIDGEDYFKRYAIENIAQNIIYSDNDISGGNKYGILDLKTGGNILYADCHVSGCAQAAYSVSACENFTDKDERYFYNCSFINTSKDTENAIYPSSSGMGIEVNNKVGKMVFDNVTVTNNARYGMWFKGVSGLVTIKDCSITLSGTTGFVFGLTNPFELRNTEILNNGKKNTNGTYSGDSFAEPTPFTTAEPTADFSTDKTQYTIGDTAVFTNTSTATDGTEFSSYLWDLGTGLPVTEKDASVTFEKAGTYEIYLVVWDNCGRGDIQHKTITVTEPEPPTEPTTTPAQEEPSDNTDSGNSNTGFIDMLINLFHRIIEWFKSLFN